MEVDDDTPTGNLQSPSIQSVLPGEPCTISPPGPNVDQCTTIESKQTDHSASSQSELTENQCTNTESEHKDHPPSSEAKEDQCTTIESEQTGDHSASGQSELTENQCTNIESKQSGQTEVQQISMQPEQTHSGPTEDQHICNTSGPAEVKCETVVSPQTGTGSLGLLGMQYRGNSSDDDCSDRSDSDSLFLISKTHFWAFRSSQFKLVFLIHYYHVSASFVIIL